MGKRMFKHALLFVGDEGAQDVVEYALLLAFVCLSGAAMFLSVGGLTSSMWSIVNSRMGAANQSS